MKSVYFILVILTTVCVSVQAKGVAAPTLNYTLFTNDNSSICLRADFAAAFEIIYTQNNEKLSKRTVIVNIEPNRTFTGECSDDHQILNVSTNWFKFSLIFNRSQDIGQSATLNRSRITLLLNPFDFPELPPELNGPNTFEVNKTLYSIPLNSSLLCYTPTRTTVNLHKDSMMNITDRRYELQATMIISHAWLQPFFNEAHDNAVTHNAGRFSQVQLCDADKRNANVVPLVVGLILVVLVAAVLTSYFIARSRTRQGYEAVA